jgi:DNA repair protein RadC
MTKLAIKEWAEADRPREKLLSHGPSSLSDAELMAILFGSGSREESAVEISRKILAHYQNNLNLLAQASLSELQRWKGIGEVKAITLAAALELGRRRKPQLSEDPQIQSSEQVAGLLKPILQDLNHEEFWIILLSRSNRVIRKVQISKGGQSGTTVDPKIVFREALENKASSLILAHNHPSGNRQPSEADIKLTHKIRDGARLLDLQVLDHVIIAQHQYYSFADEGSLQ